MVLELMGYGAALLVSFYLLAKVCDDYFVESLEEISKKLKLSSDAAGATLMAMGSSAPELFVAIMALIKPGDHADIGMGTIVGSALFNILVIIGVSSIIKKSILAWQPVVRDTLFYVISIVCLLLFFKDGQVTLGEAGVLVGVYIFYIIAVVKWKKWLGYKDNESFDDALTDDIECNPKKQKCDSWWRKCLGALDVILGKFFPDPKKNYYSVFGISILFIGALSWVLVESAVMIGEITHIPSAIIALTVLAAGTSIPDLISSIVVAKKGRGGMAISNAIGSNVFDILVGLGVPWVIMLGFAGEKMVEVNTENLISSVVLLFATVIVIFFLMFMRKWKIGRRSGYFLIVLYLMYLGWAIMEVVG